ncbi:MAG: DUF3108 domain-containing protein [Bacteroidota bacterium]|nr:DUF3108 domain-containing protein [Bacteroidota bacterium]
MALLAVALLAAAASPSAAQTRSLRSSACSPSTTVFQQGEELTYEVSYLGMGLGTIRTRVTRVRRQDGSLRVAMEGLIRTYRGVPFVTLNTLFQSQVGDQLQSIAFRNTEYLRNDTVYKHISYSFAPRRDVVHISETVDDKPHWVREDTLELEGKLWQDGLSLLFFARAHAHANCRKEVPVLMYRSKATTSIRFGVAREEMDIDAVDEDIRTVKIEGETGFTGIFGLTGGFEGWFSDDAAAVPISAKMHVLIGSVYIELVKWKRSGWSPPRVKD